MLRVHKHRPTSAHQVEICRTEWNPAGPAEETALLRSPGNPVYTAGDVPMPVSPSEVSFRSIHYSTPTAGNPPRVWLRLEELEPERVPAAPPPPPPHPLRSCEVAFPWRSACLDVVTLFRCVSRKSRLFPHRRGRDAASD